MPAKGLKKSSHARRPNAGQDVLSLFWDLASLDKGLRERAAATLLQKIAADQKSYAANPENAKDVAADGDSNKQTANLKQVLEQSSPLVVYTMRRLCQGLASSRKGARQGFATALSNLVQSCDWIKPAQIVAALKIMLSPPASAKKSEVKDALIGQLFGLGAIVRGSKKLDGDAAVEIASNLMRIADKRSFLRQAACSVLLDLAEKLKDTELQRVFNEVSPLKVMLTAPLDKATPEALYLAIRLWGRLPKDIRSVCSLLPSTRLAPTPALWRNSAAERSEEFQAAAAAVFTEAFMTALLPVLHATTSSHPKVHPAWESLLALLIPGYRIQERARGVAGIDGIQLEAFWKVAIEKDIFSSNSHERKFLGFLLFREIIPYARAEHVGTLFTPSFKHALEHSVSNKTSYLHASATKCLESIQEASKSGDKSASQAIASVLKQFGNSALKNLLKDVVAAPEPKTKARNTDRAGDSATDFKQLCAEFSKTAFKLLNPDESEESERDLQTIINEMCLVLKKSDSVAVKTSALEFLAAHAYGPTDTPSPEEATLLVKHGITSYHALLPSLRELCASRVIATADNLSKPAPVPRGKDAATEHHYLSHITKFVGQIQALMEGDEAGKVASWMALQNLLTKSAQKADATQSGKITALQHLVQLMPLYVAADGEVLEDDILQDLQGVIKDTFLNAAAKKKGKAANDAPNYMDVLVDVLLSLSGRAYSPLPSAPARDAAERVFKAFCVDLTPTGLSDMLSILTLPLDVAGEDGDEDEEMEEEEDDDQEDASDSEEKDSEDMKAEDNEEEDSAAAEEAGSDEDSDADKATDEHMFKMDEKLGAYFAAMRVDRSSKKSQRQEEVNFKLRVCSCLEAFIKKVPGSTLLPTAVNPLLTALAVAARSGEDTVLVERLSGLIQNRLCKSKAEVSGDGIDEELLKANLHRALYLASRSEDKVVATAASSAYIYMQRVAVGTKNDVSDVPAAAIDSLNVALHDYFDKKKTRLSHNLLTELFRRIPMLALVATEELVKQCTSARNEYQKLEAFALVETTLQSAKGDLSSIIDVLSHSLGDMITAAVAGPFSKPVKQIQALKACCQIAVALNSYCGGAGVVLPAAVVESVAAQVETGTVGDKVSGQVERLSGLLQQNAGTKKNKRDVKDQAVTDKKKRAKKK